MSKRLVTIKLIFSFFMLVSLFVGFVTAFKASVILGFLSLLIFPAATISGAMYLLTAGSVNVMEQIAQWAGL